MAVLFTIISLLIISLFLIIRQRPSSKERWINQAEKYSFRGLLEYVKLELNEMTRSTISDIGLSAEAKQRELYKRSELINALRRSVYGGSRDKHYVKAVIVDILANSYVNAQNIDSFIAFNNSGRLSAMDKFDIILYRYRKRYQELAFQKLVEEYHLADVKLLTADEGKYQYQITAAEIDKIYALEAINLSYQEQLEILAQRIYQSYKGFSVIDELREMQIDGISAGVSGVLENAENIPLTLHQIKNLPYNYQSVWLMYQGKSIALPFLSFGSNLELKRVCQNIYRYNNNGMLSQTQPYKVNDMIDGSRVLVVRPEFSESWAFFIRKFNLRKTNLEELIVGSGSELAIAMIRYLAKGARVTAITGAQAVGKTTLLMAMVGAIYANLNLRVQEMAFELQLRKLYPERNILSFRETATISGQMGLDIQKKTDGSVNILGEVATDEVAALMIQMTQVASLFTIFTHHAKTTTDLILSLRNSLLKCDVFRSAEVAEEQVVRVLDFDIHLERNLSGQRYISRISEIVSIQQKGLACDFLKQTGEAMQREFMHTVYDYLQRSSESHYFEVRDIIVFEEGRYILKNLPTEAQIEAMKSHMDAEDKNDFELFLKSNRRRFYA